MGVCAARPSGQRGADNAVVFNSKSVITIPERMKETRMRRVRDGSSVSPVDVNKRNHAGLTLAGGDQGLTVEMVRALKVSFAGMQTPSAPPFVEAEVRHHLQHKCQDSRQTSCS